VERELPNKWSHIILEFKNSARLFYNDIRRFGYLKIVGAEELEKIKKRYGIEPLTPNFTFANFKKVFLHRRVAIKVLLLNQQLIAGLGNIYVDEVLFQAKVYPQHQASSLTAAEISRIFKVISLILTKAITYRGTTFNNYIDTAGRKGGFVDFLQVYGRAGQKCFRCGGVVKKIRLGGRGTHYCEKCQE
jgi:formamidopyrimidine-DNA glycosylase